MNKYYKINVLFFDRYDICEEDKLYMSRKDSEEVIAEKVSNGYREIVTNALIPEKSIIDVNGPNGIYDTFRGIYYTKKGITDEILKKGYIFGTDIEYNSPTQVKNINEIIEYLNYYDINKFPKILRKIQNIKYQQQNNKTLTNNLLTKENVMKLVKDYKYREEE